MRAVLLSLLLLATPLAAAASFVDLPTRHAEAPTCGADACVPLEPGESSVLVHRGAYTFLAPDGAMLASGVASGAPVVVPEGAALLIVRP